MHLLAKDTQDCRQAPESRTEAWDRSSLRASGASPVCTCSSHLRPPGLWENTFVLLQATRLVVICCGSPGR